MRIIFVLLMIDHRDSDFKFKIHKLYDVIRAFVYQNPKI